MKKRSRGLNDSLLSENKNIKKIVSINESNYVWDTIGDVEDQTHLKQAFATIIKNYEKIKPVRMDMSKFADDFSQLVLTFLARPDSHNHQDFIEAFHQIYPYVKSASTWKGNLTDLHRNLNSFFRISKDSKAGNTDSYGYKVHPRQASGFYDK